MKNDTLQSACKSAAWLNLSYRDRLMFLYIGLHIDDRGLYWGGHKTSFCWTDNGQQDSNVDPNSGSRSRWTY